MKKSCGHECEGCIRQEIKKHEEKIAALRKKLPRTDEVSELHRIIIEHEKHPNYVPAPYYPQWDKNITPGPVFPANPIWC